LKEIDTDFKNKVADFWKWFESISKNLLQDLSRSDLIGQLDNRISHLGPFDWEIGPFDDGILFFAISPNLNIERFAITQKIIEAAPKCEGWHFLSSKPPKEWKGIWKMRNEFGKEILVDSSNWEYVLYEFDDNTFEMDMLIDDIDGDLNTCNLAVDIALTGYLGEATYMKSIKNIQFLTELNDEIEGRLTKLKHIRKHIDSLQN